MAKVPYGVETLPKISIAWVGRTNVTDRRQTTDDRQTTDGRTMTYSEHELEFTFAKNHCFYAKRTCYKNLTKIMSFVTLSAVSILIGIFHIGKFCFWVPFFKKLLLRNYVMDFVEICNVCARKAIIEAAKRIINSDKVCHSYSDLNFGVTFLEHSVYPFLKNTTNTEMK